MTIYGDVNNDGLVTIVDAMFVAQYIAGTRQFTDEQKQLADVDGDGQITQTDVTYISNYTVGNQPYGRTGQTYAGGNGQTSGQGIPIEFAIGGTIIIGLIIGGLYKLITKPRK